jgi:hypothetical protein
MFGAPSTSSSRKQPFLCKRSSAPYVAHQTGLVWQALFSIKVLCNCWGPSAYEGPQKQDLTVFLEFNV